MFLFTHRSTSVEAACNNSFNMLFSVGGGAFNIPAELFWVSECLICEVHDCIVTVKSLLSRQLHIIIILVKWKFWGEIQIVPIKP